MDRGGDDSSSKQSGKSFDRIPLRWESEWEREKERERGIKKKE
jgi:hypothetical protein